MSYRDSVIAHIQRLGTYGLRWNARASLCSVIRAECLRELERRRVEAELAVNALGGFKQ